jgi:hypothetical protein
MTARPQAGAARAELHRYGSLPALEQGDTAAVVNLAQLSDPSLVGLGTLSEQRGEVIIFNGAVWLGYANPNGTTRGRQLQQLDTQEETAAFLITASVPVWQTVLLNRDVPFEQLEQVLEDTLRAAGLDPRKPVPLVIQGPLVELRFHVVDGRNERDVARGSYTLAPGTLVGFYAATGREDFLEPDTKMHLHVLLEGHRQVGHVDRVDLPSGTLLRLPVARGR